VCMTLQIVWVELCQYDDQVKYRDAQKTCFVWGVSNRKNFSSIIFKLEPRTCGTKQNFSVVSETNQKICGRRNEHRNQTKIYLPKNKHVSHLVLFGSLKIVTMQSKYFKKSEIRFSGGAEKNKPTSRSALMAYTLRLWINFLSEHEKKPQL
jgi:hypothetical protein